LGQGHERRSAVERRCGPVPKGAGIRRVGRAILSWYMVRPLLVGRVSTLSAATRSFTANGRARALGLGRGSRLQGLLGEDSRGAETQESSGLSWWGNPSWQRTDSERERRFEVGEAGGTRRFRGSTPRVTGRQASACGKGAHSRWGIQADALVAGVGETRGDKASRHAFQHAGG